MIRTTFNCWEPQKGQLGSPERLRGCARAARRSAAVLGMGCLEPVRARGLGTFSRRARILSNLAARP